LLFVVPALITSVATLIGVVIVTVGQFVSARNDRALAHQEIDLLKKLQPDSPAASDLEMIIRKRIGKWRGRYEESRFAYIRSRNLVAMAAVAVTLAMPMLFYLKPEEALGGLPDLVRSMILTLIGGAAVALVGAIVYLIVALVRAHKEAGERRRLRDGRDKTGTDQSSSSGTGPDGSPKSSPAQSPNGSSDLASAATSPEATPDLSLGAGMVTQHRPGVPSLPASWLGPGPEMSRRFRARADCVRSGTVSTLAPLRPLEAFGLVSAQFMK
jgi:hypothetical protein